MSGHRQPRLGRLRPLLAHRRARVDCSGSWRILMDLELTGKVAIVTGGSRGIGKQVARQLALEGADVAIVARDRATLDATSRELADESGRRILAISCDTTNDASVRDMAKQVLDAFGRIDILVNAAARAGGQAPPPKLDEIDEAAFDD